MNILILNWRDIKHPNAGGAEQSTFEYAKAWARAGNQVFWFSSHFKDAKQKEVLQGVDITRRGRQYFDVQIRAFWWYMFGKHPNFDLVVDQFHGIPFFTPLYVRTKKLAYIHEVAKEVWRLNPWPWPFNIIAAAIGTFFEPWIFKIFYEKTPFMTVSESTKKDLIDWKIPPENVKVIHNGVTVVKPKTNVKKEIKKTAIYLGALAKDKGIEDAIEAFSLIDKSDNSWQFWVVGKSSPLYLRKLRKKASGFSIREKIKFWGYVDDKKKFELLARAHVLINPSVREGWGLVNIEANALETPVVAYDVSGCRDSVKNGYSGILCREKTPSCLADEAIGLLRNKSKYKNLSKNAVFWSKKFSWRASTQKSLKLLQDIS